MSKRIAVLAFAATIVVLVLAPEALAASGSEKSAGGAEIGQVILATGLGIAATAVLALLVAGHRTGRIPLFGRLATVAEGVTGLRGWSALPGTVLIGALIVAVFGMYWDIATHLDNGRDPGPLANVSHYFILAGLFGVLAAGVMAMALPLKDAGKAELRLPNGWRTPTGAILIAFCGAFSLLAFPLDDVWHRLFGQDVTLWGPTHLMLIGGAALSIIGAWLLHVEGLGGRLTRDVEALPTWTRLREFVLAGALMMGLSTFQAEFDYGVPQFRMEWHPVLLMLAAGIGLVAARIRLGRGGAIGAMAGFVAVRFMLSLIVGPGFGHTQPHLPLYLVEAIVVEAVALRVAVERKPIQFGAIAGIGIGTLGLAGEWAWSHIWMVNPWPSALLPEGAIVGLIAAVAAGVLGGFLGRTLTPTVPREPTPKWVVPAAAVVAVAVMAYCLPMPTPSQPVRATVTAQDVKPPPNRDVRATVTLDPKDAADDANWLNITAWQGGGSVVDPLRKIGPGSYETTQDIPVHGNWKTTLRLQRGREVLGLPIFFPADPAIPVEGIPASTQFTREFVFDKKNLQREQKSGVAPWLTTGAYLAVLAIALMMIAGIVWGLRRVERVHSISGEEPPKATPAEKKAGATPSVAPAS